MSMFNKLYDIDRIIKSQIKHKEIKKVLDDWSEAVKVRDWDKAGEYHKQYVKLYEEFKAIRRGKLNNEKKC